MICNASNKTIPQKPWCQIKNFKKQSYFTFKVNVSRNISNMKVDIEPSRKNSDGYRRVLEFKNLEICKILKGADLDSMLIPQTIKEFFYCVRKSMNGNILDACDIIGEIYLKNFTFSDFAVFDLFPPGDYKGKVLFHDDIDQEALTMIGFARLSKL